MGQDDRSPFGQNSFRSYKILDQVLSAAESGDKFAKDLLEKRYLFSASSPIAKSAAELVRLYRRAEAGNGSAQFLLGVMSKDDIEATDWFRKSAENGDLGGQKMLANRYLLGKGISKNAELYKKWWLLALEAGSAGDQFHTARDYENGSAPFHQDFKEALKWYRRAAQQGMAEAHSKALQLQSRLNAAEEPKPDAPPVIKRTNTKRSYFSDFERRLGRGAFTLLTWAFWTMITIGLVGWLLHQFDPLPPDADSEPMVGTGK